MNLIAFTAVGVRLLALMMFFYIFREVSRMISLATGFDTYDEWPVFLIFIMSFLLIGVWLWKGAINIAKKIVPKEVSIESESSSDFDRAHSGDSDHRFRFYSITSPSQRDGLMVSL